MSICRLLKTQGLFFPGTWGLELLWQVWGAGCWVLGAGCNNSSHHHLGKVSID